MFYIKIFNRGITSILIEAVFICIKYQDDKTETFRLVSDISAEKISYPILLASAAPPISFHKIPGPYLQRLYQIEIKCAGRKSIKKKMSASCFEHL